MNQLSNTSPLYPFPAAEKSFVFEYFYPRLQNHDEYAANSYHAQVNAQNLELLNEIYYIPDTDKLIVTISESKKSMDVYTIEKYKETYDRLMATQVRSIFMLGNELNTESRIFTAHSYVFIGSYTYEKPISRDLVEL